MPAKKKTKKTTSKKKLAGAQKSAKKTVSKKKSAGSKKLASKLKRNVKKSSSRKNQTAKSGKQPEIPIKESGFIDAGRLETEIFEPDPEVKGEFAEAAVLEIPAAVSCSMSFVRTPPRNLRLSREAISMRPGISPMYPAKRP